jgi:DNA replication and repair protein RecF
MPLFRLNINDFRNLASVNIDPLISGFNLFYGKNGSGKTSVLEAIYYLSRGRSFRSSINQHIIRNSSAKFSVFAQVNAQNGQFVPVGIERSRTGSLRVKLAGQENASFADLVELTPALLMNSNGFNLLEGGPIYRRKYLDWGAFYQRSDFFLIWKQYERSLRQRNAALRNRAAKREIAIWTAELIKNAIQLDEVRRDFVNQLLPLLNAALAELIIIQDLKLHYYPGWDESLSMEDVIIQTTDKDLYAGYTQSGPHRADFKITINQAPVKDILSRGQQKLFVCAMIVAQGAMLQQGVNRKPIYLMDDLPAELDSHSRLNLMALLAKQEAQVFLTAVEHEALIDSYANVPMKMFHVEHGNVKIAD